MKTPFLFAALLAFSSISCSDDDDSTPNLPEIQSNVKVKMQVGNILYDNVDAIIKVEAFDASDKLQWSDEFEYTGADDDGVITLPSGYDHYILTATKWGASDSQTISGAQLYNDRADGMAPTSYVFAPTIAAPKITSVVHSFENETEMEPYSKQEFEWEGDVLTTINNFDYNQESETFVPARFFDLTYNDGKVEKIHGFLTGETEHYIETLYLYNPNGTVAQIKEINSSSGVTTTVNLDYDNEDNMIVAYYSLSNNNNFTYTYSYEWKNLTWDQTRTASTVCNEGVYGYDKNINPFRHLGFVDVLLTYTSVNNMTSQDVDYKACSFPELELLENTYTYNETGLPLTKTLLYSNEKHGLDVFTY